MRYIVFLHCWKCSKLDWYVTEGEIMKTIKAFITIVQTFSECWQSRIPHLNFSTLNVIKLTFWIHSQIYVCARTQVAVGVPVYVRKCMCICIWICMYIYSHSIGYMLNICATLLMKFLAWMKQVCAAYVNVLVSIILCTLYLINYSSLLTSSFPTPFKPIYLCVSV